MKLKKILAAGAAAIALATVTGGAAYAQQTTSDLRGVISDEAGAPLSGATVVITDTRTGSARTVTTDSQGRFNAQNLNASGNYRVTASRAGYQGEAVEGIVLSISETTVVSLDLAAAGAAGDEIVVVGTRGAAVDIAAGPAATFNFDDLQNTPAISRDIKDIIKTDPRLFIDESFGNGLQCAGASPRFNSLTVDGIKLNDNFGLNSNGYPTERMPFPFDAINQVAVELAPFDVEYGGFTGCNINAVTRSGSNEFHGSGWFDYTNDTFNGKKLEGSSVDIGEFSDFRFGATLSGPIIKDRLFFFAAYEKTNETEIIGRGPAEAGAFGVQGVSQAQLDLIANVALTQYGYDVGALPSSYGEDDEKLLARIDWIINDNHRAAVTYNYNDGFSLTGSDTGPTEYEYFNHYYLRSTKLKSYSGQIFSNWSDNFSTEARVSYTTNDTGQNSVAGTDFGEVQIRTFNNGQTATVYLGADDSRHSNKLDTKTLNMKFKGDYSFNNHVLSFGYERETVDIFNLFIQHTEGEYRFDSASAGALLINPNANIDLFIAGLADDIFYGNSAGTNDPADGAAEFKFTTNTIYAQDEFNVDDIGLTITAGWRYDWYTSSDVPRVNTNFLARNGFDNTSTFDGRGLLQPRFGFNWEASDSLTLRGGGGLFSGGNPNVWLSNSFQNDSVSVIQLFDGGAPLVDTTVPGFWTNDEGGMNRPFYGVPTTMVNGVAMGAAANGSVNAVDPSFDIPSQWKAALGATWEMGGGYRLMLDFLYTRDQDAAGIVDATLEQIGTVADGRPIYRSIDRSDPDCVNPTSPLCANRNNNQDFILTNNDGGSQKVFSAALSKEFDWSNGWDADWTLAYAYTDAKDRNPMTSSVAFSNYVNFATTDPNNPSLANSNYEVPHRFTLRAGLTMPIFSEDFRTRLSLFGVVTQSRPYSFVFGASGDAFGDRLDSRHLLYMPTGAADPNVIFAPTFNTANFFATASALGLDEYAGQIVPRNDFQSDWYSQWDLRFEQEIPSVFKDHVAKAFVIIDNVGNLLNSNWGVINQAGFPGSVSLVDINEATGCALCAPGSAFGPNNEIIFTGFNAVTPDSIQQPLVKPSLWSIRFGVKYEF